MSLISRLLCASVLALVLSTNFPLAAQQPSPTPAATPQGPRAIEMKDILAWKRIGGRVSSNDGKYLAYRWSPTEGDGEFVLCRLSDGKEWRFPAGSSSGFDGGAAAFSDDAKFFAYTVAPNFKEVKKLRKERKPAQNKIVLVELATEKKTEFDKVRGFSFSGENAQWLVLSKSNANVAAGPPPSAPPAAGATPPDRASGSDMILYELATGNQLNFGNVGEFRFNKKGDWLAWTVDANEKSGNGIQARNMASGAVVPLDSDNNAVYRSLAWNDEGTVLLALRGVEHKDWEDKLYSLVGLNFTGGATRKTIYDPTQDKTFPAGMTISLNRQPRWTEDLSAFTFGIGEVKKKKDKPADKPKDGDAKPAETLAPARKPDDEEEKPDLVLWHWQDRRLQSQQQVQESSDKAYNYLSVYHIAEKKFIRLADDEVREVNPAPKQRYALGTDSRAYELTASLDGRSYQDVYVIDMKTGVRTLALKKNRRLFFASPDGTHFLYHEDGNFQSYDMTAGKSYNLTKDIKSNFYDEDDDTNNVKQPTTSFGWTKDGVSVLLSDNWDVWNVPAHGGNAVNLTGNGKKDHIRYQSRFRLDPDEKGIDLSKPVYFRAYGEWTKKTGFARVEGGSVKMLNWADANYANLTKAKNAETYFFTRETNQEFPDVYAADALLANPRKLTDGGAQQKEFHWTSGAKLLDYTSVKGDKLQGALYLPANYEPGKSCPTIVYIYEKLSQGLNAYTMPSANGFNKAAYTSNGYAVLMPDITYKMNDPGMSAVWCILPALDAAIKTGVVDKGRVALHGHSWGGYQTAFTITQSNAFKAAIAGAPLTDMISMYNLIYWNSGRGNMSIFESSQGRFTTSPVDNAEAYIRNSPVFHAKNVQTPLLILHNDKDGAVDFTQGIEYFNQLRRLQKSVVMLQYKGENHGLAQPANQRDYTVRMKEFFDHHLMGKPAPKWMTEGVPLLKLKEHLEERAGDASQ